LDTGLEVPRLADWKAGLRFYTRPPGLHIDAVGPVHSGERHCSQQLTGSRIEHVEEAVLAGLQDDVTLLAVHVQIHNRHGADSVVVPRVSRRGLVVPHVFARVCFHRNDGRQVQVIAGGWIAIQIVPGRTVARAEVDEPGYRVIDDRVPYSAAATQLPPLAT